MTHTCNIKLQTCSVGLDVARHSFQLHWLLLLCGFLAETAPYLDGTSQISRSTPASELLSDLGASFSARMLWVVELPKESCLASRDPAPFLRMDSGEVVVAEAGLFKSQAAFLNFFASGNLGLPCKEAPCCGTFSSVPPWQPSHPNLGRSKGFLRPGFRSSAAWVYNKHIARCKVMLQGCPEAFFHGLQAFQQVDWAGKPALPRFWVRLNWLNSAEFEDFRSHSGQIRGRPKNHEISRFFTVFSRFLGFCRNYPNCTSGHFSRPIQA